MADDKLRQLLERFESSKSEVYKDTEGIPTVGRGANLQSPEVPEILEQHDLDIDKVKSGEQKLAPEQIESIYDKQLAEKKRLFETRRKRNFPDADIAPHEERALASLVYNSPKLLGPRMQEKLQANDDLGVAREILLHSNRKKVPGLQKRRLEEAREYSGENFEKVVEQMTPDEKEEIRNIILNIQNIHERKKVLDEFPFLRNMNRFNKMLKK